MEAAVGISHQEKTKKSNPGGLGGCAGFHCQEEEQEYGEMGINNCTYGTAILIHHNAPESNSCVSNPPCMMEWN